MHVNQIYIKYFKERGMCYKTDPGKTLKKTLWEKATLEKNTEKNITDITKKYHSWDSNLQPPE